MNEESDRLTWRQTFHLSRHYVCVSMMRQFSRCIYPRSVSTPSDLRSRYYYVCVSNENVVAIVGDGRWWSIKCHACVLTPVGADSGPAREREKTKRRPDSRWPTADNATSRKVVWWRNSVANYAKETTTTRQRHWVIRKRVAKWKSQIRTEIC